MAAFCRSPRYSAGQHRGANPCCRTQQLQGAAMKQVAAARFSYDINELLGADSGLGIHGFRAARWQPYPNGLGLRFHTPLAMDDEDTGFSEVVHIAEGLHAFIADWRSDPRRIG